MFLFVAFIYDLYLVARFLKSRKIELMDEVKKNTKKGWLVYKNGQRIEEKDLEKLHIEKYKVSFSTDQKQIHLTNDEEVIEQAKEYALAGWPVYKNGLRIDSDAFESLCLKGYDIVINKEKKIVNLRPKGRWVV